MGHNDAVNKLNQGLLNRSQPHAVIADVKDSTWDTIPSMEEPALNTSLVLMRGPSELIRQIVVHTLWGMV
jgi:hypothetical protein